MALYSFVVPILPGKLDAWQQMSSECLGARKAEYERSRARHGVTKEYVWLQNTPMGDMAVVTIDVVDPAKFMNGLMTSEDTFDQWFFQQISDIHGFKAEDGAPPVNKLGVAWEAALVGAR